MFGRRPPRPDPALLAQVTDTAEVDLGTYPEDVLAVVGAYPARHALDHRPDTRSAFRQLDSQARKAAMQAALDRLVAEGTLNLPPGTSLEKVVTDGLDGKLAINGPLAGLYDLAFWFHRRGVEAGVIVSTAATDGLKDVQMPAGVPAPGLETCFGLPPSGGTDVFVLLVERPDYPAGTRSYTLRSVRQEFTRLAAFLFADIITEGESLAGAVSMTFRFGQASLKEEADFIRNHGEDTVHGRITFGSQRGKRKKQDEARYYKFSPSDLPELMTEQFGRAASRTQ
jgi:hypothetical protein